MSHVIHAKCEVEQYIWSERGSTFDLSSLFLETSECHGQVVTGVNHVTSTNNV